ncbi:hypothetical protein [Neoroseomonas lacus]|uniref:Uncharacterized protein n=1 Tax=Neoroseomonas lacus TaxID=287609 RepID=A0A917NI79_9PROT|nr:hypothetical protein [Neoroseomonas lacus]GGJ02389.1 hypothetical protein GCM10011320_06500 [Neoroseomonas lacus]
MGAPHPLLRDLWRAAAAPAATMRALTAPERGLRPLMAEGFADLTATAELAPLLDPLAEEDAISRVLARLRSVGVPASVAPTARRRVGLMEQGAAATPGSAAAHSMAVSRPALPAVGAVAAMPAEDRGPVRQAAPAVRFRPLVHALPDASLPTMPPQHAPDHVIPHRLVAALASEAARRPIAAAVPNAAGRQAVALLLDGIQPPVSTLLAALDETEATQRVAAQQAGPVEERLLRILGRVEATRRTAAWPHASGAERGGPASAPADAPASGFRRLAARFGGGAAQTPRQSLDGTPADSAAQLMPGLSFAADAAPDAIAPILSRVNGVAATDAELSDRLARILRREARRQGVPDEGGAG